MIIYPFNYFTLFSRKIFKIIISRIEEQMSLPQIVDKLKQQTKLIFSIYVFIVINQFNMIKPIEEYLNDWVYIPQDAFLYIPSGEEIKVGDGQKQWRKIFQNGEEYSAFQLKTLEELQQKIKSKNVQMDPWFDRANKLRFLQANKFKISNTIQSMTQTLKWRSVQLPITPSIQVNKILNSGAFYFCGRDDKYRPIIVADIGKFEPEEVELIPKALIIIMEFMIKNLLIEGQVENYILIMNLEQATFGLRSVIMKILSFTSNAYRGRLFASYILSMPSLIRWGWDSIVSKFVSENTLKKIKITGEKQNSDMWEHISKDTIQRQYGGNMENMTKQFWPPSINRLTFTNQSNEKKNYLLTVEEYKKLFDDKKLQNRKLLKKYLKKEVITPAKPTQARSKIKQSHQPNNTQSPIKSNRQLELLSQSRFGKTQKVTLDLGSSRNVTIRNQTSFIKQYNTIKTFFQSESFLKICNQVTTKS